MPEASKSEFTKEAMFCIKLLIAFAMFVELASAGAAAFVFGKSSPLPVVIWHGMGDSCCNPLSMGAVKRIIEDEVPGIYVHSLMIGGNVATDTTNGFFMNANEQVKLACKLILEDENLADGYNAIGFSQGSQFLRAVAQRCPRGMKNLITFGGQHQGVYGIPQCLGENHVLCDYVRRLLNYGAYKSWIQNFLVQAEYWHDPLNEEEYRTKSVFLADINNERDEKNEKYKANLIKLQKFVMVKFDDDTVVDPRGTEWFGFYRPGQAKEMLNVTETRLYKEDWIGLRTMDSAGKLAFLSTPGNHLQFTDKFFKEEIIQRYLV